MNKVTLAVAASLSLFMTAAATAAPNVIPMASELTVKIPVDALKNTEGCASQDCLSAVSELPIIEVNDKAELTNCSIIASLTPSKNKEHTLISPKAIKCGDQEIKLNGFSVSLMEKTETDSDLEQDFAINKNKSKIITLNKIEFDNLQP